MHHNVSKCGINDAVWQSFSTRNDLWLCSHFTHLLLSVYFLLGTVFLACIFIATLLFMLNCFHEFFVHHICTLDTAVWSAHSPSSPSSICMTNGRIGPRAKQTKMMKISVALPAGTCTVWKCYFCLTNSGDIEFHGLRYWVQFCM